jgi:hypothetical protein
MSLNHFLKINELDIEIKKSIIYVIFEIANNIYKKHDDEIKKAVEEIGKKSKLIHQGSPNVEKYADLINIYRLFAHHKSVSEGDNFYNSFPGVNPYLRETLGANIPFAINALMLTGNIPREVYNGIHNGQALYPLHLEVTQENKLPAKKGIKKSDEYFPYKSVSKLYKGDTGDNTFLATNGDKILFVRGVECYAPNSIFASKIATLVSSKHFSSERLLDNGVVASKGINSYACSAADKTTRKSRKHYIEESKKVFPGTGIIDEVTNYVVETDDNIENLGFSSKNIDEAHLSKIDFDGCSPSTSTTKNDYENDIFSRRRDGIYHALPHVQQDEGYICEKLYARLKLSMLTEPLLRSLADKGYMEKDQESKNKAIEQCHQRSNITFELFKEHQGAKKYIIDQPEIVNQCYTEIIGYIKEHFEENAQQELLTSLHNRVEFIRSELSNQFKVKIRPLKQNRGHPAEKATNTHVDNQVDHLRGVSSPYDNTLIENHITSKPQTSNDQPSSSSTKPLALISKTDQINDGTQSPRLTTKIQYPSNFFSYVGKYATYGFGIGASIGGVGGMIAGAVIGGGIGAVGGFGVGAVPGAFIGAGILGSLSAAFVGLMGGFIGTIVGISVYVYHRIKAKTGSISNQLKADATIKSGVSPQPSSSTSGMIIQFKRELAKRIATNEAALKGLIFSSKKLIPLLNSSCR